MTLPNYERLGVFYLGREFDPATQQHGAEVLYDSRDLTTHAVCIGMTGSGKTGLCISLLEEAALDGVPALVIDPKGDIGNLLLTFPQLRAADFRPWVDAGEAARKGQSVDDFAAATAKKWSDGLAEWGQDGARIERLRQAAEVTIYTPGSRSGRPLSILRSFAAPDPATLGDATALKERIGSAVSGLLGLLGIEADPIRSREHILLSALLDAAWRRGESPDLAAIIQGVQKPPFDKIGVFDLESFFAAKDRMELALRINALLAAPGFDAWLEGEALDVQKLLYTDEGRPRVSIVSVAHLSDAERMFVVTLVANELVAWMRRQSGTSSLRALFYMDEVFGYFPPAAMPPSKLPMLTLMKQARAFGLGVVLATQNPVDLDYKGLGNAGTWFIGRLQTERDKQRVVEGLLGTEAASGMDKAGLEALMSSLGQRTFLMRNVHDDAPVLMQTRWAMSYLRGPLTLAEIERLQGGATAGRAPSPVAARTAAEANAAAMPAGPARSHASGSRPVLQAGVQERFVAAPGGGAVTYQPWVGARVRTHYVDARRKLDTWRTRYYLAPAGADGPDWSQAEVLREDELRFASGPAEGASYAETPAALLSPRSHRAWASDLEDHVYRGAALELPICPTLKLSASGDESEGDFKARVAVALREKRDEAVTALRRKYEAKIDALEGREQKAQQKIDKERTQASNETVSTALSVGGSLLGALFGGRRGSVLGKARTAARSVSRASKERADVAEAEAVAVDLRARIATLNEELATEVASLEAELSEGAVPIESASVSPRKGDIAVEDLGLVWRA